MRRLISVCRPWVMSCDRAFVVQQFALRVADGAAIFGDPDAGTVLAVNLGLEVGDGVVGLHHPHEFLAPGRFHVQAAADVLDARHQFHAASRSRKCAPARRSPAGNARPAWCGRCLPRGGRTGRSNSPFPGAGRPVPDGVPARSESPVPARRWPSSSLAKYSCAPARITSTANASSWLGPRTTIGTVGALVARKVTWNRPAAFAEGSSNKTTSKELAASLVTPASKAGTVAISTGCPSSTQLLGDGLRQTPVAGNQQHFQQFRFHSVNRSRVTRRAGSVQPVQP